MKTLHLSLIAVSLFGALSAHAIWNPSWERPIRESQLKETDGRGHETGSALNIRLTMNRRDGMKQITSFTFQEQIQPKCFRAPCPPIQGKARQFTFERANPVGPGLLRYVATEVNLDPNMGIAPYIPATLTVIENVSKHRWDVSLTASQLNLHRPAPRNVRYFEGDVTPTITIQ